MYVPSAKPANSFCEANDREMADSGSVMQIMQLSQGLKKWHP